ncbi:hypothetical protein Bca52824_036048 [Brassica carinata]|uniref:Uncharacterized protein n=1 Tax=Brassica carinata TaxID=52824 RepID=A0A8X7S4T0_BRACI|nr:hypothetical protein Bca52824_036048 [Brassica carinata]
MTSNVLTVYPNLTFPIVFMSSANGSFPAGVTKVNGCFLIANDPCVHLMDELPVRYYQGGMQIIWESTEGDSCCRFSSLFDRSAAQDDLDENT